MLPNRMIALALSMSVGALSVPAPQALAANDRPVISDTQLSAIASRDLHGLDDVIQRFTDAASDEDANNQIRNMSQENLRILVALLHQKFQQETEYLKSVRDNAKATETNLGNQQSFSIGVWTGLVTSVIAAIAQSNGSAVKQDGLWKWSRRAKLFFMGMTVISAVGELAEANQSYVVVTPSELSELIHQIELYSNVIDQVDAALEPTPDFASLNLKCKRSDIGPETLLLLQRIRDAQTPEEKNSLVSHFTDPEKIAVLRKIFADVKGMQEELNQARLLAAKEHHDVRLRDTFLTDITRNSLVLTALAGFVGYRALNFKPRFVWGPQTIFTSVSAIAEAALLTGYFTHSHEVDIDRVQTIKLNTQIREQETIIFNTLKALSDEGNFEC